MLRINLHQLKFFQLGVLLQKKVIVNGTCVLLKDPDETISAMDLYRLAHAIYIKAYVEKYNSGLVVKSILDETKQLRTLQNSGILRGVWEGAKWVSSALLDLCKNSLYNYLFFWASMPELFPVSIEDAVTVQSMDTYISLNSSPTGLEGSQFENDVRIDVDLPELIDSSVNKVRKGLSKLLGDAPRTAEKVPLINTVPSGLGETGSTKKDTPKRIEENFPKYVSECCSEVKLRIMKVSVADGDCMFDSLRIAASLDITVIQLKKRLLTSKYIDTVFDKPETIRILSTPKAWGDSDILRLYAYEFCSVVCVHTVDNNKFYQFTPADDTSVSVHVYYADNHYEPMSPILEGGMMLSTLFGNTCKTKTNSFHTGISAIKNIHV